MGQVYFRKLWYFPLGIVPLMIHIHISFIHHQNHTILANASFIQKSLPPNNEKASLVSKHYSNSVMKHILMKSFHYSRWHSTLYLFIFFCASQTNRLTETGSTSWNPRADPQNQAKYRAHVRFSGRYEDCQLLERKFTWPGKIITDVSVKTYVLHDGKFYQTAKALSYKTTTFNQDQCSCHDVDWNKISEVGNKHKKQ
jgi:hypothetical protein